MGCSFSNKWYNQVVTSCGLNIDFAQFRDGDATIVGDRGVQCSGGQRSRIGLARALYRDSDVVLLDDPLSAVDSRVGRLIYYSAIQDLGVKRGKCIILATHQHQYIGNGKCVLMNEGKIVCAGSYSQCIRASNGTLAAAFQTEEATTQSVVHKESGGSVHTSKPDKTDLDNSKESDNLVDKKDQNETSNTGVVKMSTWIEYVSAIGGIWIGISILVLFAMSQTSLLLTIIEIGKWAEQSPEEQVRRRDECLYYKFPS